MVVEEELGSFEYVCRHDRFMEPGIDKILVGDLAAIDAVLEQMEQSPAAQRLSTRSVPIGLRKDSKATSS